MTKEQAEFIFNALDYDGQEAEIHTNYSGRGMMGKETFGVVFEHPTILFNAVMSYLRENPEAAAQIPDFDKLRSDNMGRQIIWY